MKKCLKKFSNFMQKNERNGKGIEVLGEEQIVIVTCVAQLVRA